MSFLKSVFAVVKKEAKAKSEKNLLSVIICQSVARQKTPLSVL
jgi:hypothetical protein